MDGLKHPSVFQKLHGQSYLINRLFPSVKTRFLWSGAYVNGGLQTLLRMMMTSGEAVKYKISLQAFSQIVKNEGTKSFFKGADANILRAAAGAGVLVGYDKLQLNVLGKKYGSGGG